MRWMIALILMSLLIGCSTIPFEKTPLVLLGDVNPEILHVEFGDRLDLSFKEVSSIAFYFKRQGYVGIGYATIDSKNETFAIACLNPAGIKIFEVKGTKDSTEEAFFAEQFKKHGDAARAVADDIRRIYFNRIPEAGARVQKGSYRAVITQPFSNGRMEYIFAGSNKYLVEKRYKEKGRKIWAVHYADYKEKNGKVHPWKIMLKHYRRDYSLIVKTKEFNK